MPSIAPETTEIAFGPVPSRRLGRSLGINNIPPKHCSYACVYCQVGRTTSLSLVRRTFHPPRQVVDAVERSVALCRQSGQRVDHLTFVPDGEPTLDLHLGEEIRALRPLGIPVAVITNGSLLWRADVRAELQGADLVSVKVDAVDEGTWRRVCHPSRVLHLGAVLDGMRHFAAEYEGKLITETMLVRGVNDDPAGLRHVARFIAELDPAAAYLAVPTRPPVEAAAALPPEERDVRAAHEIFAGALARVELLTGDTEDDFGRTGDPTQDLLGILAVHPMLETDARDYLERGGTPASALDALLAAGRVVRVPHGGRVFVRCGHGAVTDQGVRREP
jgi:wyosine [tRNA(Phe)-imidazoG37] synthetase (radical SAM superfamily)